LLVRLAYSLALNSYCVCDYGDARGYLAAGLRLFGGAGGGQWQEAPASGWPYVIVLGVVERLLGVGTGPIADHCLQLAIGNSLMDALACLLLFWAGNLAFGRATAAAAALLLAVYPPAVLSTQFCSPEPFVYLVLTAWTGFVFRCLRDRRGQAPVPPACWLALGALTAVLIACKPGLVVIPPAVVGALLVARRGGGRDDGARPSAPAVSGHSDALGGPRGPAAGLEDVYPAADNGGHRRAAPAMAGAGRAPWAGARRLTGQAQWCGLPTKAPHARTGDNQQAGGAGTGKAGERLPRKAGLGRRMKNAAMVAAGFALTLVPLVSLSGAPGERAAREVCRQVAVTLVAGNDTACDGWPVAGQSRPSPVTLADALAQICRSAAGSPGAFLCLQLRKMSRLWCSVWNPLKRHCFFMSPEWQEILHEDLLLLAFVGLMMLGSREGSPGEPPGSPRAGEISAPPGAAAGGQIMAAAAVLAAIILSHGVYLLSAPVARNGLTAVPALLLLAASALTGSLKQPEVRLRLARLVAAATLLFWAAHHWLDIRPFVANVFAGDAAILIPWVLNGAWLAALLAVCRMVLPVVQGPRPAPQVSTRRAVAAAAAATAVISVPCFLAEPANRQWCSLLSDPAVRARQDIYTPGLAGRGLFAPVAFVLVDLQSRVWSPLLKLYVNGVQVTTAPVPWMQLRGAGGAGEKALLLQARAMGVDAASFRCWWALPVPSALLRYDTTNEIVLASATADPYYSPRIYGDYPDRPGRPGGAEMLPALDDKVSLAKGFFTFAEADPRPYEVARLLGRTAGSYWFDGRTWQGKNLSSEDGTRCGQWRVRLAIPYAKTASAGPAAAGAGRPAAPAAGPLQPLVFVSDTPARGVSERDPYSMLITTSPLRVPPDLPSGSRLSFGAQLRDFEGPGTAVLGVELSGEEGGKTVSWSSPWQPSCLRIDRELTPVSITDTIPDRILRLRDLRLRMYVKPVHDDLWKLRPGQALSRSIAVQQASLVILPPLGLPPAPAREWLIF